MKPLTIERKLDNRLLLRGSAGVSDQIVSAGTHFALNLYAARILTIEAYGVFAVGYALVVLCQMIHYSLVAEPLIVFGAGLSRPRFRRHVGMSLGFHIRILGLGVVIAGLGGLWLGHLAHGDTIAWIISLAAVNVATLTMQLFRRALQAQNELGAALMGTTLYSVFIGLGLVWLFLHRVSSPELLFLVMAVSAGIVTVWQFRRLSPRLTTPPKDGLLSAMVRYGGWASAATLLSWAGSSGPYVLLPVLSSVSQAAVLRTAMNLYLPFQHFILGITAVALPAFARRVSRGEATKLSSAAWQLITWLGILGLLYGLAVVLARHSLVAILYGGRFGENTVRVLILGSVLPAIWTALFVQVAVLRALGRSDWVFYSHAFAFGSVGIAGLTIGARFGAAGVTIALALLQTATLVGVSIGIGRAQKDREVLADVEAKSLAAAIGHA